MLFLTCVISREVENQYTFHSDYSFIKSMKEKGMPWAAQSVNLTTRQEGVLSNIAKSRSARKDHIIRAKIVLLSAAGWSNARTSKEVGLGKLAVGKWRRRWLKNEEILLEVENKEQKKSDYRRCVESVLSDVPRPGTPPKFTAKQLCQIVSVASEKPEVSGLPLSHWSLSSLADELQKRGIVESISTSQLSIFLK
jgi:putative transposase